MDHWINENVSGSLDQWEWQRITGPMGVAADHWTNGNGTGLLDQWEQALGCSLIFLPWEAHGVQGEIPGEFCYAERIRAERGAT